MNISILFSVTTDDDQPVQSVQSSVIVVDSDGPLGNTDTDGTAPEATTESEAVQDPVIPTENKGESEVESTIDSSPQPKTYTTTSAKDTSMHI